MDNKRLELLKKMCILTAVGLSLKEDFDAEPFEAFSNEEIEIVENFIHSCENDGEELDPEAILLDFFQKGYAEVISEIKETLIGFRYWLDEPGEINACYFTENHLPLYHSCEYLAGMLFPDDVFFLMEKPVPGIRIMPVYSWADG